MKWTCPYCNLLQEVTEYRRDIAVTKLFCASRGVFENFTEEKFKFYLFTTVCANSECEKFSLKGELHGVKSFDAVQPVFKKIWNLVPESSAKPQPEYIPEAIKEDYYEACKIRDLSPKASATLARRCLQGMVQHFCEIKKGRLFDQLEELSKRVEDGKAPLGVTPESVEGIDHVRGIGNIGAHMEGDVNFIIPIDPKEAQILIELIETLFDEWYIAQHKRKEKFDKIKKLGAQKKQEKTASKNKS